LTGLSEFEDQHPGYELELYKEEYRPESSTKPQERAEIPLPERARIPEQETLQDIEELFVKTGERKDAVRPRLRDLQFFFLINPKAGQGKGQDILEKNPKAFAFSTNFWKDLQGCAEIK